MHDEHGLDPSPRAAELLPALEWLAEGVQSVARALRLAASSDDPALRELALRHAEAGKEHVARLMALWHSRDTGLAGSLARALAEGRGAREPADDDVDGPEPPPDAAPDEEGLAELLEPLATAPVPTPAPAPVPVPKAATPAPIPPAQPAATNAALGRTFGPFKIRG